MKLQEWPKKHWRPRLLGDFNENTEKNGRRKKYSTTHASNGGMHKTCGVNCKSNEFHGTHLGMCLLLDSNPVKNTKTRWEQKKTMVQRAINYALDMILSPF